jgi:hypothetical protein
MADEAGLLPVIWSDGQLVTQAGLLHQKNIIFLPIRPQMFHCPTKHLIWH